MSSETCKRLQTMSTAETIREALAPALLEIQELYDGWTGDGNDPELGAGGICDEVASIMGDAIAGRGWGMTEGGQDGDDHAYLLVGVEGECYEVDLPHHLYERGGGYSWRKVPGVTFTLDMFTVVRVQHVER